MIEFDDVPNEPNGPRMANAHADGSNGTDPPVATWKAAASLGLCAVGLGLSAYTLWVHYHPSALACPLASGTVNCQAVLTSAQSVVLGIPVPVFGLGFFLGLGMLCLPAAWHSRRPGVHWLRLAVAVVGIGMVVYLIATELFTIKKICLWCTGVHIVTLILFALVVTSTPALLQSAGSEGSRGS